MKANSTNEIWDRFDRGELDLVSAAIYSEDRTQTMDFSVPLAYVPYVLLVRKGTNDVHSEADLKDKEVLVVERSAMMRYAAARS